MGLEVLLELLRHRRVMKAYVHGILTLFRRVDTSKMLDGTGEACCKLAGKLILAARLLISKIGSRHLELNPLFRKRISDKTVLVVR